MTSDARITERDLSAAQSPAIRRLVQSALQSIVSGTETKTPRTQAEWVALLGDALMAHGDSEHLMVLSTMAANGLGTEELIQTYIPEASRYIGEKWVSDEASFVDVTTGASRLQALFRDHHSDGSDKQLLDRSIPLGQTVLIVIPQFEQHSLGAFVAADGFRRHGLWVRMAIGMTDAEIAELVTSNRFAMIGISLATWRSVENSAKFVDSLRSSVEDLPPVVIGGRVVEDRNKVRRRTGADFAVRSVGEAIERCGLATVSAPLHIDAAR